LGIETATWTASVAIIDEAHTLAERTLAGSTSHAVSLIPLVDEVLGAAGVRLSDVGLLAVSIGPGSFTGLRIGLSVAKGIALVNRIPVVGVPTLEALALAAGPCAGVVHPVLDARKREVYAAAFRHSPRGLETVWDAMVCSAEQLAQRLQPPCTLCGSGVDTYGAVFRDRWGAAIELVPAGAIEPSAPAVARLGLAAFRQRGADGRDEVQPHYVRASEAERARSTSV
jgi:tRNA threonylcarbamoyladenosine biosynthesis protein TsaB